jgi:long-subunit fatty acid transport protein
MTGTMAQMVNKRTGISAAVALLAVLFGASARASVGINGMNDLYDSVEAQGMGGAFTAVVDDEQSLYYNPAGLAGVQRPKLTYIDVQGQVAQETITTFSSSLSSFNHLSGDTLNAFMGKELFAQATMTPSFVLPGFGIGLIVDQQVALYPQNIALPSITLGYQTTNGVKVGYAYSFFPGAGRKEGMNEVRLGVGGEMLFRRGGYYNLSESQMLNISEDSLKNMVGNFGSGVGADLGVQYIRHQNKRLSLMAGAAWESIGNVTFSTPTAAPQQGDLSVGLGARYQMPGLRVTTAYDLRHLDQSTDWRMRQHAGVELKIPLFAVSGGVNEISYTWGVSVDVWLAKVSFVSYAEELAAEAGLETERRYMVRVAFSL